MNNLSNILLSILFVSGEGIETEYICQKLECTRAQIESAIKDLRKAFGGECGVHIIKYNDKLQLVTNPDYAESVATVLNPIKERQLSKTALEVAAIIAYKQPITRLEIEDIRGVSSDYAIQLLLNHNLITVVGRKDTIGKPMLFGTTDEFLRRFELETLNQLPDYDELLERIRQVREEQNKSDSLYNEFEIPTDEELQEETLQKISEDIEDVDSQETNAG